MRFTREQRKRLVELLLSIPAASTFAGRTALLADTGGLSLNRDQNSARLDLEAIVQQLELLRAGTILSALIENAVEYARGTSVEMELDALWS